jgi:hypothetical protein
LQAQLDHENQIKANTEKAFTEVKKILNKYSENKKVTIYK